MDILETKVALPEAETTQEKEKIVGEEAERSNSSKERRTA
jgi:hypothetical protein